MPRYKILIEYEGTRYNGWQKQPKGITVQGEIEAALSRILGRELAIYGQGRTDSGVHALGQVAHFDTDKMLDIPKIKYALLGVLPKDIAVWNLMEVDNSFHARFDAKSRRYRYQIVTRPRPMMRNFAARVLKPVELEVMTECAAAIKGEYDFESFTKSSEEQPNGRCLVTRSDFEVSDSLITYHIEANRFLRRMVRRLIGSILQVGQGKWEKNKFLDLLHNPSKIKGGHAAPARGLILEKVIY